MQGSGNDLSRMPAGISDLSALVRDHQGFRAGLSEQVFEITQPVARGEISISPEMNAPVSQAFERLDQAKQRLEVAMQDFHEAMQSLLNLFQ